jgi:hypothetical protein
LRRTRITSKEASSSRKNTGRARASPATLPFDSSICRWKPTPVRTADARSPYRQCRCSSNRGVNRFPIFSEVRRLGKPPGWDATRGLLSITCIETGYLGLIELCRGVLSFVALVATNSSTISEQSFREMCGPLAVMRFPRGGFWHLRIVAQEGLQLFTASFVHTYPAIRI